MILMPVLMLLPLIALPIFWILPLSQALPIYLCLVALSAVTFRVMRKTMKLPAKTGAEYLVGKEARVVSKSGPAYELQYLVRLDGELWSARSNDVLEPGERVIITAIRSNSLIVKHKALIERVLQSLMLSGTTIWLFQCFRLLPSRCIAYFSTHTFR
jgi:membrane protein implicated in regulation of membrane protease activity